MDMIWIESARNGPPWFGPPYPTSSTLTRSLPFSGPSRAVDGKNALDTLALKNAVRTMTSVTTTTTAISATLTMRPTVDPRPRRVRGR